MLRLKRGDLKPDLHFYDIRDENGELIDLTLVKSVHVVAHRKEVFLFDRDISDSGTSDGQATMLWQGPTTSGDPPEEVPGDTDVAGRLKIELVITYHDDREVTIPNDGFFDVEITRDLSRS